MFALKWIHKNKPSTVSLPNDEEIHAFNGFIRSNSITSPLDIQSCDSATLKEMIGEIDSMYFSSAVDCGEYEIQHNLTQQYRDLQAIINRVETLERQSTAVCRQLSNLILEKQPHYENELKNVILLQDVNSAAYEQCIETRKSLEVLLENVVKPRVIVIRNYKRCLRLSRVLEILKRIRTLKNDMFAINKLIEEHRFCDAISLHRQSCQTTEDFKPYSCVDSLQQSLRAVNHKIDDALDNVLANGCENFDPSQYALLQKAFERLGNTMTTVAQLQVHVTTKIHERAATVLAGFSAGSFTEDAKNITDYEALCSSLPASILVTALSGLCKSLWTILVCYHRISLWHESASQRGQNSKEKEEKETEVSIHSPDLIRQWHAYVASKLALNRGRVWMDIVSRVQPLLSNIAANAKQFTFEDIVVTLNIVNRLVQIGKEFAGLMSFDLLEVLKNSIRGFFGEFHRKHMERLRLFLDHESWEHVPVKPGFTLLDLHEFHSLTEILAPTEDASANVRPNLSEPTSPSQGKFFKEPYDCDFFGLESNASRRKHMNSVESNETITNGIAEVDNSGPPTTDDHQEGTSTSPLLASTTIEVLRLFGRYLQMMRLLRPIASDVMHCIGQIFDYYLFVVYSLFGKPLLSTEANQLPERLRKTLTRISTYLIAPAGHSSVEKGSRFVAPDCILGVSKQTADSNTMENMEDVTNYIQRHLVGVESLVYLSGVLEKELLSHIREYLPESKRGLLDAFRDQSLVTTLEIRETTARHLASQIFPNLLLFSGHSKLDALSPDTDKAYLLRRLVATNPGWTTKTVATEPSGYLQLVNTAISRFSIALKSLSSHLHSTPPPSALRTLWMGAMVWLSTELLEGLAGVQDCSGEGRSQMLLDVQSTALLCETESGIRPFLNLNLLVDYIQAFFVPIHEWSNWLEATGVHRYTQDQCLGLANCLARGDRNVRQRLTATVTAVYARRQHSIPMTVSGGAGGGSIEG